MSDFEILTTTRAWVAAPWDYNSCIGLRFRADGCGNMVFERLQIVRDEIKFSFSLQPRTNWHGYSMAGSFGNLSH